MKSVLFIFIAVILAVHGHALPGKSLKPMAPSAEPLILVLGKSQRTTKLPDLNLSKLKPSQYVLFYFSIDDKQKSPQHSAQDLADYIQKFQKPRLTLLAYGRDGITARESLNLLSKKNDIESVPQIHMIAIDSPWEDSSFGDCPSKTFSLRRFWSKSTCAPLFDDLYTTPWPPQFSLTMLFTKQVEKNWTTAEGSLRDLPQKIADYISYGKSVTGTAEELNFWKALRSSAQYPYFEISLNDLRTEIPLTANQIRKKMAAYFTRLPRVKNPVARPLREAEIDFSGIDKVSW